MELGKVPQETVDSAIYLEGEAKIPSESFPSDAPVGIYKILGRNSVDIIKSGGFKISALEVESVLLQHPQISQVAVVATPCETWGEKVTAVAVLKGDRMLNVSDLRGWGKERMASYKVPQRLEIWTELPRNQLGKLEKKKIMKRL